MRSRRAKPGSPRGVTREERAYYTFSRRAYRVFAPFYDAVTVPLRRLRPEVAVLAAVGPGVRVLDVATGTGAQAIAFAERGGDVVGADLSPAMLRLARKKNHLPNLVFEQADAAALPYADGGFGVTCISFALHEMPGTVRQRVLAEMARVTRPGGKVVVVDYGLPHNAVARALFYRFVKLYEGESYAKFMKADLHAALEQAGLVVRDDRSALAGAARIIVASRV